MPGMGLRLARTKGQEGSSGNLRRYPIAPGNTAAIFYGDVVLLNAGNVEEASGASSNNDFDIAGVFMGCEYVDADGGRRFSPRWDGVAGRTDIWAMVAMPGSSTFLIKGNDGATYTQADIGRRKGIVYAAGSALDGQSRIMLGAPGANVATGPLMVLGEVDIPLGGGAWFEVGIVRSQLEP